MYINTFEEVIGPRIKPRSVLEYTCHKLLAAGENYGSILLKVEVVLQNEKKEEEVLHLVAKLPPPKGFVWQMFTIPVTFKKELDYYKKVVPTLENFLKELNLDLDFLNALPKYYGSRVSTKLDSNAIDEDAVLLLENLKSQGYEVGDRFTGFDLNASKLIIKIMATFHAVPIAFREAFPLEFDKEILPPICLKYNMDLTKEYANEIVKSYIDFLKPFGKDFSAYQQKMVDNFFYRVKMHHKPADNNIFNTIVHNDMWTNNMLVKVSNGCVTDMKLIDFQVTNYRPGTNDLIYFLFTSVQLSVLKEQTDNLIQYYYDALIEALSKLKTDTSKFGWETFKKTIKPESRREWSHIVKLLCPIYTKKVKAKELEDFSPEDFKPCLENVHENFAPKLEYIISEFIKRDWL